MYAAAGRSMAIDIGSLLFGGRVRTRTSLGHARAPCRFCDFALRKLGSTLRIRQRVFHLSSKSNESSEMRSMADYRFAALGKLSFFWNDFDHAHSSYFSPTLLLLLEYRYLSFYRILIPLQIKSSKGQRSAQTTHYYSKLFRINYHVITVPTRDRKQRPENTISLICYARARLSYNFHRSKVNFISAGWFDFSTAYVISISTSN